MKQATNIINLFKNYAHKSLENEPLEEEPPKEGTLKSYPQKRSSYLKMMRSQYIM